MKSSLPIAAVALAFLSSAYGAEPLRDTDGNIEVVIVSASRISQPASEISSNVARISGETLKLISQTHINEAMQRVSGAWISRGNGQEHLTALRSPVLTGAGGCGAFLMAQDGIPLRASGFCNVNELFDANSEQAGAIEVIKGPASALYGSNAMHGLINILTPSVEDEDNLQVGAEIGPNDYYRTKLSANYANFRIDLNGTSDGGYKHDAGYGQQKATVKYDGQLGAFNAIATLGFSNLNQETAGFISGTDSYKDSEAAKQNPNPEAFRDSQTVRGNIRLQRTLTNGTEIVVTPYFRDTDMTFIQHFLPGQAIEANGHTSVGVQSAWYIDRLIVGIDAESTSAFLREFQPNATVSGSAFLVNTIPSGAHYDYDVDATTWALFAQYQLPISDSMLLTLGGRYESVSYDYDNKLMDGRTKDDGTACSFGGCRFSRPSDREDTFRNFSPKISFSQYLTANTQWYLQLSRGFRAPQATELYRLQNTQVVSAIDSEELDSLEVGLRGTYERLGYDLSFYRMNKDNFIFRDSSRTNVDNGKTEHQGVELALNFAWSDNIRSEMNWSYAIHQYANNPPLATTPIDGNDIDTAPRNFGSANILWQYSEGGRVELEWTHLGKYFEDPENQHPYEGHDLLNLRWGMDVSETWRLAARIINLTDKAYAERADFAFGSDRYFVGEPRSVFVSLTGSI
ncbi:MAG: outer membrane receptor protein involved in Fe transport [Candidatus Azotimanducaceae bacterium]|jgi:outer membrane receptor protein involved in Fe transport